ncbi:YhcH/YjgK/YiaL family protein [Bacteroidota bacterium]
MIFDTISNAEIYYGLGEKFERALNFLKDTDFSNMEACKIDIDGDNMFAMVQEYKTKDPDDGKWEAHRNYIDIQYILSGSEDFGFVNFEYLDILEPYNEETDKALYEGDGDFLQLHEGEFVILFPYEAHMPCLAIEESETVRKVVIKVAV